MATFRFAIDRQAYRQTHIPMRREYNWMA